MGTPKALLPFDGQPLIVHVVAALRALFDDIVVVAAPGQELPALPVTLVRDEVAYQGPVGGITYGLRAASADVCFVTACDSAFLNRRLIAHLMSRIDGCDAVVPYWEGRAQPLHAVYRRSVLPLLEAQLARGELRPVSLFAKVSTCRIEEDEIRRFDAGGASFFNMNTPEDYAEAVRRWESAHCTVELFGVARLVANTREVSVALSPGATVSDVLGALAEKLPALVDRVINSDRRTLVDGYACNVNGTEFIRSGAAPVENGDSLVILSADAGG
jgi:molybdopterin-guanine dinucleotide biosynthesis protein A/molybdopterin converting factor small subunit